MADQTDAILAFFKDETGHKGALTPDIDLILSTHTHEDDLEDILNAFADRFCIDWAAFDARFHLYNRQCGGALSMPYIPITARSLAKAAETGSWSVAYPPAPPSGWPVHNHSFWQMALFWCAVVLAGLLWMIYA